MSARPHCVTIFHVYAQEQRRGRVLQTTRQGYKVSTETVYHCTCMVIGTPRSALMLTSKTQEGWVSFPWQNQRQGTSIPLAVGNSESS